MITNHIKTIVNLAENNLFVNEDDEFELGSQYTDEWCSAEYHLEHTKVENDTHQKIINDAVLALGKMTVNSYGYMVCPDDNYGELFAAIEKLKTLIV